MKNILFVVTKSFCRQCTRKMDKKVVVSYVNTYLKYDARINATEKHSYFLNISRTFLVLFITLLHFGFAFSLLSNVNFCFRILSNGTIFIARVDFYLIRMYRLYYLCNIFLCIVFFRIFFLFCIVLWCNNVNCNNIFAIFG